LWQQLLLMLLSLCSNADEITPALPVNLLLVPVRHQPCASHCASPHCVHNTSTTDSLFLLLLSHGIAASILDAAAPGEAVVSHNYLSLSCYHYYY